MGRGGILTVSLGLGAGGLGFGLAWGGLGFGLASGGLTFGAGGFGLGLAGASLMVTRCCVGVGLLAAPEDNIA